MKTVNAFILVDAENTFNKLHQKIHWCRTYIQKSQSRKHQKLRLPIYTYLHISYNTPATLMEKNGFHILSVEGVAQGDDAAMAMYAISEQ